MDRNGHGGNIYKAAAEYGIQRDSLLDFSANINPLGVPGVIRDVVLTGIDQLVHYPDPDCTELKEAISKYLEVTEERIIIGNGASEIIFLLFTLLQPRRVLIPAPSFSEYAKAAQCCNVEIEYFEMKEQEDYRLNLEGLLASMDSSIDAVMLCNPNNPTSTLLDQASLVRIIEYAQGKNVYVILDEAFIELTVDGNQNSMVAYLEQFNNLFIIRAFTKLFAVPGLRLGYGLGNRELIRKMWDRKLPWSINTFACMLGKVLHEGGDYLNRTAGWLRVEIDWLWRQLCDIPGIKVFRPNTNFILVKLLSEQITSSTLRGRMAASGVLIRDASNFVFLNEKFIRLAVKDRESNLRMLEELKKQLTDDI